MALVLLSKLFARMIAFISSRESILCPATPDPVVEEAPPVMPVLVLVKLARSLSLARPPAHGESEFEVEEEDPVNVRGKAGGTADWFMSAFRCECVVTGGEQADSGE